MIEFHLQLCSIGAELYDPRHISGLKFEKSAIIAKVFGGRCNVCLHSAELQAPYRGHYIQKKIFNVDFYHISPYFYPTLHRHYVDERRG